MRIGIYDPYLDSLSGGEKYMLTMASCLSKENEVSLFWEIGLEERIKDEALRKLNIDLKEVKFTKNIFDSQISLFSRLLLSKKFDLIIYLSDGSIPIVSSKLILHFQFPVEWVRQSLSTRIKLKRVEKSICNSFFTKKHIDKKFNINSKILYPPILLKQRKVKKENIILHVGRFGMDIEGTNYKKQDVMIQAFKEMVENGLEEWKLTLIIGVREEDKEKTEILKKMSEGYPIEIIENIQNNILWDYYSKAKIYWHASGYNENLDAHPEKAEHFGISTVEAMGAGAVPVVINAGGQKEIVEDKRSGLLWDSLEELKEKTLILVRNPNFMNKISANARERAKFFAGERFCKEVNDLIEKV